MGSIPLGGGKAYVAATRSRNDLLQTIEALLREVAFQPDAQVDMGTLNALSGLLSAWEAYMKAISSSNRGWELNDLQLEEQEMYARCGHFMRVIRALHTPQTTEGQA